MDRILIFSSEEQISIFESTQGFLVDGTFKVVSAMFYQLYIIYPVYHHHVVPVIFSILRRKDAEKYKRSIAEILEFALRWLTERIMLDFEKVCVKAYQTNFPRVVLPECYFHSRQNVYRK